MLQFILLQASGTNAMVQILFFVGIFVVFYFFMIRPQQKRQQEQKTFADELKTGDYVVTSGGIHGKVIANEGSTVIIEIDKGVKIKCEKFAISMEQSKAMQNTSK